MALKFSKDEIIGFLQEYEDGKSIIDICKDLGISMATFYIWKRKYSSPSNTESRIKILEQENFHLKQMYAELSLNFWAMKEKILLNYPIKYERK